jgi:hypothetical protein
VPLGVPGRKFTPSAWIPVTTLGPLLSADDINNFLWFIDLNLATFGEFVTSGGTTTLGVPPDPDFTDFGEQLMALVIPGGAPGVKATRTGTADLASRGFSYVLSFVADTDDVGGATIRAGFRDGSSAAFPSLPDQAFSVTTTPTLFTWDPIASDDAGWDAPATLRLFDNLGDIASGKRVRISNLMLNLGPVGAENLFLPWRPSPNEVGLIRFLPIVNALQAALFAVSAGMRVQVGQNSNLQLAPAGPVKVVVL